jgi:hypothetical protein
MGAAAPSTNPRAVISHAQFAREVEMKPKTFNELRRDFPDLFPKAIRRGGKYYAPRGEFFAFIDALRGAPAPTQK